MCTHTFLDGHTRGHIANANQAVQIIRKDWALEVVIEEDRDNDAPHHRESDSELNSSCQKAVFTC